MYSRGRLQKGKLFVFQNAESHAIQLVPPGYHDDGIFVNQTEPLKAHGGYLQVTSMSHIMRKSVICHVYNTYSCYIQNSKTLAAFCSGAGHLTKPTKWPVRLVWSVSSLLAWRKLGSLATHWAHSEDADQTGRMRSESLLGAHCHFVGFVMSWRKLRILSTLMVCSCG